MKLIGRGRACDATLFRGPETGMFVSLREQDVVVVYGERAVDDSSFVIYAPGYDVRRGGIKFNILEDFYDCCEVLKNQLFPKIPCNLLAFIV